MDIINKAKMALLCMQRHSWEQGVCAQAFFEAGDTETAVGLVLDMANRQRDDGRLGLMYGETTCTDPLSALEAHVKAVEITRDEMLKTALYKALRWVLEDAPRNETGIVYHVDYAKQFWVDSMYMLPPGLVKAGYEAEAIKQADGYIEHLYIPEKSLFKHIWDETESRFIIDKFWGVGNGWAISGLARMIEGINDSNTKKRYAEIVRKTIESALELQRNDMLFHNILDDPDTFVEANFAQMLCYTIKKGVQTGWLDASFMKRVPETLDAVLKQVDEYGILRGACGAPHFDKPGAAPEAQAFFILSRL